MAELAKELSSETSLVLPESYTLETGSGILQRQGLHLRHKDLATELTAKQSIYKQSLQLPALIIYNQSLLDRANNANEYLQEQIINIIFAVNEVRAKHPEVKRPLGEKRMADYDKIQNATDVTSDQLFQLEKLHNELKEEVYKKLKSQIIQWQNLCIEAAAKLTETIAKEGVNLPEDFNVILAKHLERAGANKIHPDELKELKIKGKLSYVEQAIVCALKEVDADGNN